MDRVVLHVDLDYFYAQLEELRNPSFKDKPIVVCMYSGRTEDSGAVSTSNYVARSYGVKAGIPIALAKKKLDGVDSLFVAADLPYYQAISADIMGLLHSTCEPIEYASIDEAYLEITSKVDSWEEALSFAKQLSASIYSHFFLTCSIGIGANKLVAKMASDLNKPNGITLVPPTLFHDTFDSSDVGKIPGVGPKTREILEAMGIQTIGSLFAKDPSVIVSSFGKSFGSYLVAASKGYDDSPVQGKDEQKQLSRMKTLKVDTQDLSAIQSQSKELIEDILATLESQSLASKGVGVLLVLEDMKLVTKSRALHQFSKETFQKTINDLFREACSDLKKNVRRIGVRAENLYSIKGQRTLGEF